MALKSLKSPGAAFERLWAAKPSAAACEGLSPALPWYLPIGPTSCLYWASKLLRGTFWAPLKSLKSPALEPQNPPQQLAKASRLLCHGTLPKPHKLSLLGFETATWHVWAPLKSLKSPAAALAREGVPPALPWYLSRGPTSCFYWASKLPPLESLKSPAAAFEGLWTAKPSAAACEGLPPALP